MSQSQSQGPVTIPSTMVTTPGSLPDVCARHGRSTARRVDFALQSRTQISGSRALSGNVLSMGNRLGQWAQQVRVTHVRGWPLCPTCTARRRVFFWCSFVMFWGGLTALAVSLVIRLVAGEPTSALLVPALLGFGLPVLAVIPFVQGSLPRITLARTSSDGTAVVIDKPHPTFAAQLNTGGASSRSA